MTIPVIPTDLFTYHPSTNTFTAEASEIPFPSTGPISIVSSKTGVEIPFTLVSTERDAEGEVICWVYRQSVNDGHFYGTVKIWND